ncbi:type VII secretion integral membrane protein EccD [Gordonia sp. VNK21]|uniref:type VII secretion integral membrane protein EccD n=1 Tax=Gordonia sp. VNK21 TaxID=3382483 RepID=UPI0038D36416
MTAVCTGEGNGPGITPEPELVRLSVLGGSRQLDIALPAQLPLAVMLPDVLGHLRIPPPPPDQYREWTLARIGGAPLPPESTLAAAQVCDGEVLVLRENLPTAPGAIVDDVVDGLAAQTEADAPSWSQRAARSTGYAVTVGAALVAAVAAASAGVPATTAVLGAAVAVVLAGAAAVGSRTGAENGSVAVLAGCAAMAAALAGSAAPVQDSPAARLLCAGGCALTAAVITHRCTGVAHALHAAIVTAGALAATAGAGMLLTAAPVPAAAITAAAALTVVLLAGRLAVAAARLPLPPVPATSTAAPPDGPGAVTVAVDGLDAVPQNDDRVAAIAAVALVDLDVLRSRARLAAGYLTGIVVASAVTAATALLVASGAASRPPSGWDQRIFAAAVAVSLLVRAHSHADRSQSAALIGAGCAAALFTAAGTSSPIVLAAAAGVLAVAAFAVGTTAGDHAFSPLQRRIAELGGYAVLVAVAPLLLWLLGVYRTVRGL